MQHSHSSLHHGKDNTRRKHKLLRVATNRLESEVTIVVAYPLHCVMQIAMPDHQSVLLLTTASHCQVPALHCLVLAYTVDRCISKSEPEPWIIGPRSQRSGRMQSSASTLPHFPVASSSVASFPLKTVGASLTASKQPSRIIGAAAKEAAAKVAAAHEPEVATRWRRAVPPRQFSIQRQ